MLMKSNLTVQRQKSINPLPNKRRALPCKPKANQHSGGKGIKRKCSNSGISIDNKKLKKGEFNIIGAQIPDFVDPNSNAAKVTPESIASDQPNIAKGKNPQDKG